MAASVWLEKTQTSHPLDVIEQVVVAREWMFDRNADSEMAARVPGSWCDYSMYFSWNEAIGALHFSLAFDLRVPGKRTAAARELLAMINERMWLGHFCIWENEGQPVFRHVLPLRGAAGATAGQVEDMVEVGIDECERFFPAFQYVAWSGKSPSDAMAAAMIDTVGEA